MFTLGIFLYGIGLLAYIAWDSYCSRQNPSRIFNANTKRNVIANVAERVAKNIAQNKATRRVHA